MTGIRKKNKILGFIFAVLAVWMVIFQNPSYAAQRGSLNIKTEQAGMTVYLYRVAEKQAGVYVLNEKFQASGADVSGGGSREAAITLTDFVKAQGIQPYRTGTGSGKHVVFRNLPDGGIICQAAVARGRPLGEALFFRRGWKRHVRCSNQNIC